MPPKPVESRYKKLSQREHVLQRAGMYIGSTAPTTEERWTINPETDLMEKRLVEYVPGLLKIVDEALVNARDHKIRDPSVQTIRVDVDKATGSISVYNDGSGIEVALHAEHNVYVPELLFGHMLSGENFDEDADAPGPSTGRIVGGCHGIGSKALNIHSTTFTIESVDATRKKRYVQEFKNNMSVVGKPHITAASVKPYTRVTFVPDYARFGLPGLTDGMYDVIVKRVYDLAAVTPPDVKVYLNGSMLKIRKFEQYVDAYLGSDKTAVPRVYERINERWEIAAAVSPESQFTQVSFVNGIHTSNGGKHVEYVTNQIVRKVLELLAKKKHPNVKASYVKENLFVFVNATIENPSYSSQCKEVRSFHTKHFEPCA
jgi:DNA topoisomerase-2